MIRVVPSGIHSLFAATPAMRCRSLTVSSSAAPPDRAPVCTIHDTEHRASLYALLRRASFSADSRRRFRLFTWFTCDVRPCVCDGETRFGKDGARREARHTRGVR